MESKSEQNKKARVVQTENQLAKELTLLTYTIRKLVDEINLLKTEIKNTRVVQVPYPYPVYHKPSNPILNPPISFKNQ